MSDSDNSASTQPSSELVRWLQSLALPLWARCILVIVFLAVMLGGLGLVGWGAMQRDKEAVSAAIGLLTIALPVSLVVVGLVFGQRSEKRLVALTDAILDQLLPQQIEQIACRPRGRQCSKLSRSGCRATYLVKTPGDDSLRPPLKFSVELNVKKVNLMFSLPAGLPLHGTQARQAVLQSYQHVIAGATAEGYQANSELAKYGGEDGGTAILFYRTLPEDFLLRPMEKLYFAQDLGFFVRGILEAQESALDALSPSGSAA